MRIIPPPQLETMIDLTLAGAETGATSAAMPSNAAERHARHSRIICAFILDQYAQCRTVQIIKLPAVQRPEKCCKPQKTKAERNGYQKGDTGHFTAPFSRSALATTMTEEPDMESAAINGVTIPMMASGTAIRL